MYEELKKKAKKRVESKKAFFLVAMIFGAISTILLFISMNFGGMVFFWINFPTLVFALILGVMYVAIFGLPFAGMSAEEWEEIEMEKEMARLYRKEGPVLPPAEEDLTEEDLLELKELERLKRKWDRGEDFV